MKYAKLRGKIREKYKRQADFARAIGLNPSSLSAKLCGVVDWKRGEIEKACVLLDIAPDDVYAYFFAAEVA